MDILSKPIFYEFITFNYESVFKRKFLKEINMEYQHSFPELKDLINNWISRPQIMEIDELLTFDEVINNIPSVDMSLVMFSQSLRTRSSYNINHPYRLNTKFYESILVDTHKKFIIDFKNYYIRIFKIYNGDEDLEKIIEQLSKRNKELIHTNNTNNTTIKIIILLSIIIIIIFLIILVVLVVLFKMYENTLKNKFNKQLELGF